MIGYSRDGHVVTVELQREERRNALSTQMCVGIRESVEQAVEDGARAVVLTGRGTSFCAGADLSGDVYAEGFTDSLAEMLRTIENAPIPVIAAVNGPAIGAGTQLALASDLRVVAPGARFGVPAARLGISVDRWTVRRLASLVGGGPARAVFLAAEPIHAEEAFARGLANRIGELADAQAWAHEIAQLAPLSLRAMKMFLNDDGTRDESTPEQTAALAAAWLSEDAQEARRARAERRDPVFQGR
ncbi:enoyl-CoA hydratase [Rhodococcus sp. Z13]|uniref:Enoyl-CoA hydratase n=1 Tax=Rhodococcus sacchari TaxID=2962047 RepID=A0ACD4DI35_9NOCA|nr:enoyl-CoA hydratase [Rhodococcus sp. Z13]UYP19730.1 enoyl-CoA hydratase [Rhodococcus sp. Z13]